jgi:hypothetical protein
MVRDPVKTPLSLAAVAALVGIVDVLRLPAGFGGTQTTYYKDDSDYRIADTGDHRSYGDTGVQVDNPSPGNFSLISHTYFVSGTTQNVGESFLAYYDHPLGVSTSAYIPPVSFLPLLVR